MTLEQKIAQLHGAMETIDIYAITAQAAESGADMDQLAAQIRVERHVTAIDELGIPRFRITNGPVGVGMGDGTPSPPATSLPMTIGLAAGFDPDLAHSYGDIIGSETATLGQHVLEGPGVCLHRTTIAGRNFEYFSEDPYLSGVMGVAVTKAIQAHDVIAMAKHYVVNDQEYERFRASVEVDEHVLRELYLLPFEMLVKDAEIAAVMSSYNRVRGVYATEYRYTLTDILRTEWGFDGYVQSDFWSCRSCAPSLNAGMDHEMPDAKWLNETNVKAALSDTSLEIETIDRALVRRYTQMFRFGQFERPYEPGEIDAQAHGAVARTIGSQIAVLLKNDGGLLPLDRRRRFHRHHRSVQVRRRGLPGRRRLVQGDPVVHRAAAGRHAGCAAGPRLVRNRDQADRRRRSVQPGRGQERRPRSADVVVLMAGLVATEGADQPDANLLNDQNRMLDELLGINPTTVVVLKDSNPVLMPWIDKAPAVLEAWNQGAEDGHVVADLLFGVVNPSGKVPTSYPRSEDDTLYAGRPERYPGTDEGDGYPVIRYSEGLEIGYRWFQAPRHPAAVRLRLRPVLHHLRYRRRVGGRAGRCECAGDRDRVGDQYRPRGRRRGGAGVSRSARGGTAAQAACRVPEGLRRAGGVQAGDDHHRPGGDEPPVQRLGLLRPTASRSSRGSTPSTLATPPTTLRTRRLSPLAEPGDTWSLTDAPLPR